MKFRASILFLVFTLTYSCTNDPLNPIDSIPAKEFLPNFLDTTVIRYNFESRITDEKLSGEIINNHQSNDKEVSFVTNQDVLPGKSVRGIKQTFIRGGVHNGYIKDFYWGADDNGLFLTEGETQLKTRYAIQTPVQIGTKWETTEDTYDKKSVTFTTTIVAVNDNINTPIGNFKALKTRSVSTENDSNIGTKIIERWYVRSIGCIKEEIEGQFRANITFPGNPGTEEIIHRTVQTRVIDSVFRFIIK